MQSVKRVLFFVRVLGVTALLILSLSPLSTDASGTQESAPPELIQRFQSPKFFWRGKTHLEKQMQFDRKIMVSALHEDGRYHLKLGVLVKAAPAFCLQKAQELEILKNIPEHFPELNWDKAKRTLSVTVKFMGVRRSLVAKFWPSSEPIISPESRANQTKSAAVVKLDTTSQKPKTDPEKLYFRVESGWLQGLEGVFVFSAMAETLTEASVFAESRNRFVELPDFLVLFAVEGVMQHVADSLRAMVERDVTQQGTSTKN